MKNNKNKRIIILTIILTLLFTVVAYAYTEGSGGNIHSNQYYNSLTDDELKDNASSGIYESTVVGKIDYVHPNYTDYNGFDQNELHHNMSYIYYKNLNKYLLNKTNAEIADSFNLDLNFYNEISRYDPKFEKDKLFLLCPKVDAQPGDSVSTVYLDETNSSGVVLKQDKNGLNYKFSFERDGDDWIIIDKSTTY